MCPNYVPKLSECDQSAAELLMYWRFTTAFCQFLRVPPKRHKCFKKGVDQSTPNLVGTLSDHRYTSGSKMVQISLSVSERQRFKVESRWAIRPKWHLLTRVKLRDGQEDVSGNNTSFHYDRTCGVHLTGGHCTVCRGEVQGVVSSPTASGEIEHGFQRFQSVTECLLLRCLS